MVPTKPRRRAIPEATRRAVARRHGCEPFTSQPAWCVYCAAAGTINWLTRSWVHFTALELDHVIPRSAGGDGSPENIVLACRRCNRRKGARVDWPAR